MPLHLFERCWIGFRLNSGLWQHIASTVMFELFGSGSFYGIEARH